jgi:6-phosphogluconolactonase (cycloisomerase 2 family)
MVVTPNDDILFVGSSQTTAIYAYSIGTGGALSILNNGTAAAGEEVTSMAMSPDGNYLFALDASGSYLAQYSINYTTGALTQQSLTSFNLTGVTPEAVAVAPSGDFLAVSLGQAGFIVYPYTASTGAVAGTSGTPFTGSTTTSYYGLAIDSNNNLYVAETNGVVSVPVNSAGVPTVTSVTPKSAGTGPRGVAVSGSFVYVANSGDSTISLYTATSGGVLTALGNAISGPASVTTLSTDATGKYLLAAGYSSGSGLDLYSIATTGLITLDGSQPTTTNVAVSSAIASVH